MNRGLLAKALGECWVGTLLFGLGLAVTEAVEAYATLHYREQISFLWGQVDLIRPFLRGLLGPELAEQIGPTMLLSLPWIHPLALTLLWAQAIAYCTRIPAGEVDRGTIDVLLGLPVARGQVYRTYTLVWLASGLALVILAAVGNTLGLRLLGQERIDTRRLFILTTNLFCLYIAVGGMTWLASAMSNQRGRAVGVALGVVLASFLLNYLAQAWPPAQRVSFLSILQYYRPLVIIRDATWPARDILVLLATGGGLWAAGGIVFARRDLSTV
jgi:beta-exotoxin I transport system permease protein